MTSTLTRKPSIASLFGSSSGVNVKGHGESSVQPTGSSFSIHAYKNSIRDDERRINLPKSVETPDSSPSKNIDDIALELPNCIEKLFHFKFNSTQTSSQSATGAAGKHKSPLSSFLLDWLQQVDTLDKDILNDESNRTVLNQSLRVCQQDSDDLSLAEARKEDKKSSGGSIFRRKNNPGKGDTDANSQISTWSKASAIKKSWMKSIRGGFSSNKKDLDGLGQGIKNSGSVSSSLFIAAGSHSTKRLAKLFLRIPKIQLCKGTSSLVVDDVSPFFLVLKVNDEEKLISKNFTLSEMENGMSLEEGYLFDVEEFSNCAASIQLFQCLPDASTNAGTLRFGKGSNLPTNNTNIFSTLKRKSKPPLAGMDSNHNWVKMLQDSQNSSPPKVKNGPGFFNDQNIRTNIHEIALSLKNAELMTSFNFEFPANSTDLANGVFYFTKVESNSNHITKLVEFELQMGVFMEDEFGNSEALASIENQRLCVGYLTIYATSVAKNSANRIQIWRRHWFVLYGLKLRVFDCEYQEDKRFVGEMDLSKIVSVKSAERDRIYLPNTIQLEISGLGRLFLHADDKDSYNLWSEKFGIVLDAVRGIPAPKAQP